ncbi:hypothetical protein C5Y96_07050 [Blastopirellula marina]|uniref:Uncharacterized protein n=1 Tax=Blastopirellula marina TaxID=124 RepID=A0A2S8FXN0_9BACT|nr:MULTISPECIES: hypothetical protein [Pirellulaceae]PQO36913.1 hypothetical protein C5Y96_07050 [Blastopirellula marina]RCS53628.1 hypothetical protein DTL36_07060 [Bremerella cremea]
MDNANQTTESNIEGTENAGQSSPQVASSGRMGRWAKNTVYGFAGLVLLSLVITVVSPEVAVAVSQYLPQEYQSTLFATSDSGGTCSAGIPVGGFNGSCCSHTSGCSAGTSCGAMDEVDQTLAVEIPSLSLDTMLAGLRDYETDL